MDWQKKGAKETTRSTATGTSSENHFPFIQSYYACKMLSNRPNRLTHVVPNLNPLGIKRCVSGISMSFKSECHIMMQIKYTKNLNPWRFEFGTTLS